MNARQESFCLEYARTGNAAESYKIAYGKLNQTPVFLATSAQRLMNQKKIKDRIRELSDSMASEKIANAREMQEILTKMIREESEEEVFVSESDGDGGVHVKKTTKHISFRDKVAAIDKLARMQGAYNDSTSVSVTVPIFANEEKLQD